MTLHFLISIDGVAPEGGTIPADAAVEIRRIKTPNDGFGHVTFDSSTVNDPIKTTFVQIENTLCEES